MSRTSSHSASSSAWSTRSPVTTTYFAPLEAMESTMRRNKAILRRAFRDLLPASILHRGKMGFGVPLTEWLRGRLRPMLEDAMGTLQQRGLLDAAEIRRLLAEHLSGAEDHRDRLWLLLVLELWHRRFLP